MSNNGLQFSSLNGIQSTFPFGRPPRGAAEAWERICSLTEDIRITVDKRQHDGTFVAEIFVEGSFLCDFVVTAKSWKQFFADKARG